MCEPSYVLKFEEGTPVSDKASIWSFLYNKKRRC